MIAIRPLERCDRAVLRFEFRLLSPQSRYGRVVDAWQRRGVGRALFAALAPRAHAAGIRRFTAVSLWDNRAAVGLARSIELDGIHVDLVLHA